MFNYLGMDIQAFQACNVAYSMLKPWLFLFLFLRTRNHYDFIFTLYLPLCNHRLDLDNVLLQFFCCCFFFCVENVFISQSGLWYHKNARHKLAKQINSKKMMWLIVLMLRDLRKIVEFFFSLLRMMFPVGLTAPYWLGSFTNRLLFLFASIDERNTTVKS